MILTTTMYTEDQLVMISGLQHLAFCARQCALIHVEQQWAENRATVLGELLHEKVHSDSHETRGEIRIARSLRLVSYRYGLVGQADVVEFHKTQSGDHSVKLRKRSGRWMPFPVEYKKGRPKRDNVDRVQLCAQALCLEEQFDVSIGEGALYYGTNRRRERVAFNSALREETIQVIEDLHQLIRSGVTPKAEYGRKCRNCSLLEICMPKWSQLVSANHYNRVLFKEPMEP